MSNSSKWTVRVASGALELRAVLNNLEDEHYEVHTVTESTPLEFTVIARKRGI